jgi:hypothetical protein
MSENMNKEQETRYPKTIEETLTDIAYKEQMTDTVDVHILLMTELVKDLCARVIALEAALYD